MKTLFRSYSFFTSTTEEWRLYSLPESSRNTHDKAYLLHAETAYVMKPKNDTLATIRLTRHSILSKIHALLSLIIIRENFFDDGNQQSFSMN